MIEVKNIKKRFGDKMVINDVSAVMQTGQMQSDHWHQRKRQNRFDEMHGGLI